MVPETPRGLRDVLPSEAVWRESIRDRMRDCFASWGYMPLETPTLEIKECIDQGGGISSRPLSMIDAEGKVLVLRPDVTLPIARMVASRLAGQDGPFRFRYAQQVFRERSDDQAQSREFTQLGIECIGPSGPAADAEVVAALVKALRACDIEDFSVAICTVGVLLALIDGAGMPEEWSQQLLAAYHRSNFVAVEALAAAADVDPRYGKALAMLPRLRGGRKAIEDCRELVDDLGVDAGLDGLISTWDLLEAAGVSDDVVVDFSIMSGFDYYTGLVMEAYATGFGLSLGGGGRYDKMLAAYGRTEPAAGFAVSLERIMQALRAQGQQVRRRTPDAIIGGSDLSAVFRAAASLREDGVCVCMASSSDVVGEARRQGIPRAIEIRDGRLVETIVGGEAR